MKWGALIGMLTLALVAFWLGRQSAPVRTEHVTARDTIWRERLLPSDTIIVTIPQERILYRTQEVVRTETVRVPINLGRFVVTRPEPLRVEPGKATLTYWNPGAERWEQSIYSVPPPRWQRSIYAFGFYGRYGYGVGVGLRIQYRSAEAFAEGSTQGARVGVRLHLWR